MKEETFYISAIATTAFFGLLSWCLVPVILEKLDYHGGLIAILALIIAPPVALVALLFATDWRE